MGIKQRFEYLDIAKGIGILMVVWAHVLVVGWSHRLIYAFHMPLFFLISGMLYNKDKYLTFSAFLGARIKRLLLPYVIYSFVTWAIWALFRYLQGAEVESYWMPLLQTFIAQGSGEFMVHNSPLWFIPCLFAVEIMYYLVCKTKELVAFIICALVAVTGVLMAHIFGEKYLFLLPWNLDAAFYALLFYFIGNTFQRHIGHRELMQWIGANRVASFSLSIVLFLLLLYLSQNYGECSMGSSSYQCPEWLFFLRAFIGCGWMIIMCAILCTLSPLHKIISPLKWCGMNSLDIMCQHVPIKGIMIIALTKFLKLNVDVSGSMPLSLIVFALTMTVCAILTLMINKFTKKI